MSQPLTNIDLVLQGRMHIRQWEMQVFLLRIGTIKAEKAQQETSKFGAAVAVHLWYALGEPWSSADENQYSQGQTRSPLHFYGSDLQQLSRHFTDVLNNQSCFTRAEKNGINQRAVRLHKVEQPTLEEPLEVVGELKNGKAGSSSSICQRWLRLGVTMQMSLLTIGSAFMSHNQVIFSLHPQYTQL